MSLLQEAQDGVLDLKAVSAPGAGRGRAGEGARDPGAGRGAREGCWAGNRGGGGGGGAGAVAGLRRVGKEAG